MPLFFLNVKFLIIFLHSNGNFLEVRITATRMGPSCLSCIDYTAFDNVCVSYLMYAFTEVERSSTMMSQMYMHLLEVDTGYCCIGTIVTLLCKMLYSVLIKRNTFHVWEISLQRISPFHHYVYRMVNLTASVYNMKICNDFDVIETIWVMLMCVWSVAAINSFLGILYEVILISQD